MNSYSNPHWQSQSQDCLMDAIIKTTSLVEKYLDISGEKKTQESYGTSNFFLRFGGFTKPTGITDNELSDAFKVFKSGERTSALSTLISKYNLSYTEIFILIVCVSGELVSSFGSLCGSYHGSSNQEYPTFQLIASLFDRFDASATAQSSLLIQGKLLRVESFKDDFFNQSAVFVDPPILHYLLGSDYYDIQIGTIFDKHTPVTKLKAHLITNATSDAIERMGSLFKRSLAENYGACVQLMGTDVTNKENMIQAVAETTSSGLIELDCFAIPTDVDYFSAFVARLQRWIKLENSLLYIKADRIENGQLDRIQATRKLINSIESPVIISTLEPVSWVENNTLNIEVNVLDDRDQIVLWHRYLSFQLTPEIAERLRQLVSQFNLSAPAIKTIASKLLVPDSAKGITAFDRLWDNCRVQARQTLDGLATRVTSNASWDNLVLPENTQKQLASIISQVNNKAKVNQAFAGRRGLGITALFSGVSGTGKTTAAEVIANKLKLDLYKIELSTVISKYIGETEKNLRKIFDAAEAGGAILLFDEADALFGKRTEVKDSKDRHSNAEISYLLQKMESYRGLAILTTNIKDGIDSAFKRRLRFVVDFAFPDEAARERIWRSVFPKAEMTQELDYKLLASLKLAGGNIFSIALNSAFEAAADSESVQMKHIVSAAKDEIKKLELDSSQLEMIVFRLNRDRPDWQGRANERVVQPSFASDRSEPNLVTQSDRETSNNFTSGSTNNKGDRTSVNRQEEKQSNLARQLFAGDSSIEAQEQEVSNNYALLSPEQIFALAQQWLKEHNYLEGYRVLKAGVACNQEHSGLNFWLGWTIHHGKFDQQEEALSAFRRAESGNQQWINNPEEAVATWYWQARVMDDMPSSDLKLVCKLYKKYYNALPDGTYTGKARRRYNLALERDLFPD